MKACKSCGNIKPLDQFYRQRGMADGHRNECKDCRREAVTSNRNERIEQYRAYDRERSATRVRDPQKIRAKTAVLHAIRSGTLIRQPCEVEGCSAKAEGHHEDYSKPLVVRWRCRRHHMELHRETA